MGRVSKRNTRGMVKIESILLKKCGIPVLRRKMKRKRKKRREMLAVVKKHKKKKKNKRGNMADVFSSPASQAAADVSRAINVRHR